MEEFYTLKKLFEYGYRRGKEWSNYDEPFKFNIFVNEVNYGKM